MGRNERSSLTSECFCLGQRRQRTLGGTGEGCEERRGQERRYLCGGEGRASVSPRGGGGGHVQRPWAGTSWKGRRDEEEARVHEHGDRA